MTPFVAPGLVNLLGVGLIALSVSGCLGGPGPGAGTTEAPSSSGGGTTAALTPEIAYAEPFATAPKPKPKPEKIYPPPSRLMGMSHVQVIGLLGEPGFRRQDNPAMIWQYRTETCALDVFMYRSGEGSPYRVDHFEARHREKGAITAKDCFTALLKAREQRRTG